MSASRGIATRLAIGFAVVLALLCGIAAMSAYFLTVSRDEVVRFSRSDLAFLDQSSRAEQSHMRQSVLIRDVVGYEDLKVQRAARKAINEESRRFDAELARLERAAQGDATRLRLVRAIRGDHDPLPALMREAMDKIDDARFDEAKKLVYEKLGPQQARVEAHFEALVSAVSAGGRAAAEQAEARHRQVIGTMALLAAFALLVGAGAAVRVTRSVTRPLAEALAVAERVAAGNLSQEVMVRGRDETARLLSALASMQAELRGMVGEIRAASLSLSGASDQIVRGSVELSQRTEEQAAALEETTASMRDLTASVERNAENAMRADGMSRESAQLAERGGDAVQQVVASMGGISQSSSRIAEIIALIDGIAFQTNILALNAAVEAARAGEHGRGFAVVAAEVRSLAQRSAAAAKDIAELVHETQRRVEAGSGEVESAGGTIAGIVESVVRVRGLMELIATASRQQSGSIGEVHRTVRELDHATQHNAVRVQQTVAAAEALRAQATRLADAVRAFRLDDGDLAEISVPDVSLPPPSRSRSSSAPEPTALPG